MGRCVLISDAAKEVQVESHVLRYWEEELHLPIKRNELGHRYYTEADVERFKQIKSMKERGLQLKAIKMILKNGRLDILGENVDGLIKENGGTKESKGEERTAEIGIERGTERNPERASEREAEKTAEETVDNAVDSAIDRIGDGAIGKRKCKDLQVTDAHETPGLAIEIVEKGQSISSETSGDKLQVREMQQTDEREEKSRKLQWILQEMIKQAVRENNVELCRELKESVIKELDYQFRVQEEREDSREKRFVERSEEHYKKMDELLRKKSNRRFL